LIILIILLGYENVTVHRLVRNKQLRLSDTGLALLQNCTLLHFCVLHHISYE
jgi:hypothetical protein